jgi:formamidopyrimidine-DNA glycosylase
MPELPELEALRIRMSQIVDGALVTRVEVNPKKSYILRYPPDDFARELPARQIKRLWRRGKHLVFETELARGGEQRSLVVNPMLGGRFQVAGADEPVPATHVFTLHLAGREEVRYLDFRDMGRIYWTSDPSRDVPVWADLGQELPKVRPPNQPVGFQQGANELLPGLPVLAGWLVVAGTKERSADEHHHRQPREENRVG